MLQPVWGVGDVADRSRSSYRAEMVTLYCVALMESALYGLLTDMELGKKRH